MSFNGPVGSVLVIQTAFIGDAILASAVLEELHTAFPKAAIDFMVRKGNDGLFKSHPFLRNLLVWDKKNGKFKNLWRLLKVVRSNKYEVVINLQRYATTGMFTVFSGAKHRAGFNKNPFSFLFDSVAKHVFSAAGESTVHETDRNFALLKKVFPEKFSSSHPLPPKLYPTQSDIEKAEAYTAVPFITISPFSVWPTKEVPVSKWTAFLDQLSFEGNVYLLGGPDESPRAEALLAGVQRKDKVVNLAGKLGLLPSAALVKKAVINYVNDSAPLHLCSATDAPMCAIFCSTSPRFGFGPRSSFYQIVEVKDLSCKPCGIHGHKKCPAGHFKCGNDLSIAAMNQVFEMAIARQKN